MTDITAFSNHLLEFGSAQVPCALGKGGLVFAADKREGDGASPIGRYPLRRVHYRADRLGEIVTALPKRVIGPNDGWCDDPDHPAYNQLIERPFAQSHERLWRDDRIYDIVIEVGHNDSPPLPGLGSAIFIHLKRGEYEPTEGCVAIAPEHMLDLLRLVAPGDALEISERAFVGA